MNELLSADALISLLTLTLLEIVLGIDNIIFISIVTARLEPALQPKARRIGLALALVARVGLLFGITYIIGMKTDLINMGPVHLSGRDLILLFGGLFLIGKSTTEIHDKLEGTEEVSGPNKVYAGFVSIITQIVLIDIVFSFDSVLTAVGLVSDIRIMIIAVVISMGVMFFFATPISNFVNRHPTVKILALAFLIMIGFLLVIEAFDVHVQKGFAYSAMAFSLIVELINIKMRKNSEPVELKNSKMNPE